MICGHCLIYIYMFGVFFPQLSDLPKDVFHVSVTLVNHVNHLH